MPSPRVAEPVPGALPTVSLNLPRKAPVYVDETHSAQPGTGSWGRFGA